MSQHMEALAAANKVRFARAELRRQLAAREVTAQQILKDMPFGSGSMTLGVLLGFQYRWGQTRVTSFLRPLAISESRQLMGLTAREVTKIVEALDDRVSGVGEEYGERWLAA